MGENILDKYCGHYFEHYLVCTQYEMNEEGYHGLADLYLQIEGKETFYKLIEEINLIEANDDWDAFVLRLKYFVPDANRAAVVKIAHIAKSVFDRII